jgi:dolichyl-phosphate-mannose--protein O-mannosyl transferase
MVIALGAGLRLVDLGNPTRVVFDESYYAQDACTYLALGRDVCGAVSEASWMHPPLGKWFIAAGILLGGHDPTAWRLPSVLAGVVTIAALYLLTRRLTGSVIAGGVAAGILALDPLSIVSSRVAMLDIFVACAGMLAVVFAVMHRDALANRGSDARVTPWLVAAGLSCGVAVATKWSGILLLVTVTVLVVAWEIDARSAAGGRRQAVRNLLPVLLGCFVVLPALVYCASYVGRLEGEVLALPWQQDALPRVFGGRQLHMATFHFGLNATHPYASPAWSWLIGKRAVVYFFEVDPAGRYREILAFANLGIWLPGAAAAGWATVRFALNRHLRWAEFVVCITVVGSYLPWLLLTTGRQFVFLHYILPTIPFLALAIGWAVTRFRSRVRAFVAVGILTAAALVVGFWAPLIYGWPLSYDEWRMRIPFTDCAPGPVVDGDGRFIANPYGGSPPPGWCWV